MTAAERVIRAHIARRHRPAEQAQVRLLAGGAAACSACWPAMIVPARS